MKKWLWIIGSVIWQVAAAAILEWLTGPMDVYRADYGASAIIAIIGIIMAAASTAYGVAQQRLTNRYQAKVAKNNQKIAEMAAQDAIKRGEMEEKRHREKVARLAGRQRNALAAAGVDLGAGASVDILEDTAGLGEIDALVIRRNAQREAWANRAHGTSYGAEAALANAAALNQAIGGALEGGSTVLGAAYRYFPDE